MKWQWNRRDNKTFRSEANDTHLSDVSAENIGTDGADSDKRDDKVQLRSVSPSVRDALEEQVWSLPRQIHWMDSMLHRKRNVNTSRQSLFV